MVACTQGTCQINDLVQSYATVLRGPLDSKPLSGNSSAGDGMSAVVPSNAWDNNGDAASGSGDFGCMPISPLSSGSIADPNRKGAIFGMSEDMEHWTKMRMVVSEYMRKQEAYQKSIRGRLSALGREITSTVTFQVRTTQDTQTH